MDRRIEQTEGERVLSLLELPTGSVCVRFSDPSNPEPFYLQGVQNDREENGYWGCHLLFGEFFTSLEAAEARATELAAGKPVHIDAVARAHAEVSK